MRCLQPYDLNPIVVDVQNCFMFGGLANETGPIPACDGFLARWPV
jgi:hypothetical protein